MKYGSAFVSAGIDFPSKLITNRRVLNMLCAGILKPVHLQLNPTNRCNLNCSFCSCKGVDRKIELGIDRIEKLCSDLHETLQAVTITGGGEPLMHRQFVDLVNMLHDKSLDLGMATNGLLMGKYDKDVFRNFTWIRISLSKESAKSGIMELAEEYIINGPASDWAFSYVCSEDSQVDAEIIASFIRKFNDHVTHFRIVGDILSLDNRVEQVRNILANMNVSIDNVIFQSRAVYTKGHPQCRIARIKPVITAEGRIQPCCGTQYAFLDIDKRGKYNQETDIGLIEDAREIFNGPHFNGSVCDVCYYNSYNQALSKFFETVEHQSFI